MGNQLCSLRTQNIEHYAASHRHCFDVTVRLSKKTFTIDSTILLHVVSKKKHQENLYV